MPNIPHVSQVVNQYYLEYRLNEKPDFISTGKVMCWCNCGERTEWLDAYTEMSEIAVFLTAHEPTESNGVRMMVGIGELAGYVLEPEDSPNGARLHLVHKCGWSKDISGVEVPLTNIVLEILENQHVCGLKKEVNDGADPVEGAG